MRIADIRIPVEKLASLGKPLFDKSFQSGSDLARRLDTNTNTLWSWFFRRGLKPSDALAIAAELDERSADMAYRASQLRKLAQEYETPESAAAASEPKQPKVERVRKIVEPTIPVARKQHPVKMKPLTPRAGIREITPDLKRLSGRSGARLREA